MSADRRLNELTAHELSGLFSSGEVSAREVLAAVYERIDEVEDEIHAYVLETREVAEAQAREIDERRAQKEELPPLAGVPIALKDIYCTKGIETTCGSRILKGFVPPYDADVIERCRRNGLVFVGKTNMDEFAMGSSTETSCFGPTRNPWDSSRVAGGSSGGSAAAVAAGEATCALGSDTGGSVRQPASFCGVVGLKPTYGLVSRYGLIAYASSLDCVGPITKDVMDCALLLGVLAGYDWRDSTSIAQPLPDYVRALERSTVRALRIGIPREFLGEGIDPEVKEAVLRSAQTLEGLGARCEDVSLPRIPYAVPCYYIIALAEASSNLARYDGVQYGYRNDRTTDIIGMYSASRTAGFGAEVKRRMMLGTYTLSAGYYDDFYLKAQQVRTLIRRDFEKAFESCDVLLGPTYPSPPFRLGELIDDPLQMYLSDIYTVCANLAGIPAISVPCGCSRRGLPIGAQMLSPALSEQRLLTTAYCLERALPKIRKPQAGKG